MTPTLAELEDSCFGIQALRTSFSCHGESKHDFGFLMLEEPSIPVRRILDTDLTTDYKTRLRLASLDEIGQ